MKLLFLTSRFPFPLEKGDKLRAYYFIKHLSRYHSIYLFAISDKQPDKHAYEELKPYCSAIHVEVINSAESVWQMIKAIPTQTPFQVAYFTSNRAQRNLIAFAEKHHINKVFCHLIRMAEYANVLPGKKAVIDYMDAFAKGVERMAAKIVWWKRLPYKIEHLRLLKYEANVFDSFSQHIIISAQDREFINHTNKKAITVIPNGVEFEYFTPQQIQKKYDLLFMGNMAYPPNVDSVIYAAKKIMPLIYKREPTATFLIAGATPVKQVYNLQSDNITVSGWVDDARTVFAASRIMIAPMLISIGLQNKILQAMAMKIPCVISALANNAIGAPNDCVCVAENAEQYATYIIDLLEHPEKAQVMAERAYAFVKQHFDWEQNVALANRLL